MGILHPTTANNRIHTVHRVSIAALGVFLLIFGVLGLTERLEFLSSQGAIIMGLSSNGLLATISVLVAVVLIVAAARGGPTASSVGIVLGVLFLLSGLANLFVLGTEANMLGFRLSNVIFSLVIGMMLLFLGAYGRISGHLPPESPYYRPGRETVDDDSRTAAEKITDAILDRELAEAERAVALNYASAEQTEGVRRAAASRGQSERRRAWRTTTTSRPELQGARPPIPESEPDRT
jgi:Domain of unknown function (DUF4383)